MLKDKKENLELVEHHDTGDIKTTSIEKKDLEDGPLILTPLYGHKRKLVRNKIGIWMLEYGFGTRTSIKCKE